MQSNASETGSMKKLKKAGNVNVVGAFFNYIFSEISKILKTELAKYTTW